MRPWRAPRSGGYAPATSGPANPQPPRGPGSVLITPSTPVSGRPRPRPPRPDPRPVLPPTWRNVCGEPLGDAPGVFCDRTVKTYADGSKRPHRRHPHRYQWRSR